MSFPSSVYRLILARLPGVTFAQEPRGETFLLVLCNVVCRGWETPRADTWGAAGAHGNGGPAFAVGAGGLPLHVCGCTRDSSSLSRYVTPETILPCGADARADREAGSEAHGEITPRPAGAPLPPGLVELSGASVRSAPSVRLRSDDRAVPSSRYKTGQCGPHRTVTSHRRQVPDGSQRTFPLLVNTPVRSTGAWSAAPQLSLSRAFCVAARAARLPAASVPAGSGLWSAAACGREGAGGQAPAESLRRSCRGASGGASVPEPAGSRVMFENCAPPWGALLLRELHPRGGGAGSAHRKPDLH